VPDGLHAVTEEVSLELHRAVAERLLAEPVLLDRARQRVAGWLRDGTVARTYAEAWQVVLAGPVEAVARFLSDPGERARALRQTSPFAGFLEPRARWSVWRRARGKGPRP